MSNKGYVRLDLGKRSIEAARLYDDNDRIERFQCGTDESGLRSLLAWLNSGDAICLEAGGLATRIARRLRTELPEASITLLDPKRLAIIYLSMQKN